MSTVSSGSPATTWTWTIPDTTHATGGTGSSTDSGDALSKTAGGEMGKDQFVKLLVAQMQNQDPMNPMDGKDLAVQLAQFSSVEQLMNMNTKLDALTAALKTQSPTTPTTGS